MVYTHHFCLTLSFTQTLYFFCCFCSHSVYFFQPLKIFAHLPYLPWHFRFYPKQINVKWAALIDARWKRTQRKHIESLWNSMTACASPSLSDNNLFTSIFHIQDDNQERKRNKIKTTKMWRTLFVAFLRWRGFNRWPYVFKPKQCLKQGKNTFLFSPKKKEIILSL